MNPTGTVNPDFEILRFSSAFLSVRPAAVRDSFSRLATGLCPLRRRLRDTPAPTDRVFVGARCRSRQGHWRRGAERVPPRSPVASQVKKVGVTIRPHAAPQGASSTLSTARAWCSSARSSDGSPLAHAPRARTEPIRPWEGEQPDALEW